MTHLVCGGGIVKLMKLKKMEMKDRSRRRTRVSRLPGNTFQPRSTTLAIIAIVAIIAVVIVVSISIITDTIISVKFEDSVFESFRQGGEGGNLLTHLCHISGGQFSSLASQRVQQRFLNFILTAIPYFTRALKKQ